MPYLEEIPDFEQAGFGAFYDELPLWSAPFGLMLLDRVPLRRGARILDVGAGTGFLSIELAQRCGAESEVVAVDPWPEAVSRLEDKLRFLAIDNVRVVTADAAEVDLPDGSFDLVVSNLGINNFDDPRSVLRRCFALAKPGAALAMTSNVVGHMQELYDVYRDVLCELGAEGRLAALDEHIAHRGTAESIRALIEESGFEIDDVAEDAFCLRYADAGAMLRHWFIRLGFLPAWKEIAPAGRVEETFALLARRLDESTGGALALRIPMVCIAARRPLEEPGDSA